MTKTFNLTKRFLFNMFIVLTPTKLDHFNGTPFLNSFILTTVKNPYLKSLFLLNYFSFKWAKITFRGKGYRIRNLKKKNKLTLNFGKSHWTRLLFNNTYWYFTKLKRIYYLIISSANSNMPIFKNTFRTIRAVNRYTLRGLRFKQQVIKRRFGKISQLAAAVYR